MRFLIVTTLFSFVTRASISLAPAYFALLPVAMAGKAGEIPYTAPAQMRAGESSKLASYVTFGTDAVAPSEEAEQPPAGPPLWDRDPSEWAKPPPPREVVSTPQKAGNEKSGRMRAPAALPVAAKAPPTLPQPPAKPNPVLAAPTPPVRGLPQTGKTTAASPQVMGPEAPRISTLTSPAASLELPSLEKLSAELGYKPNELKRFVEDFATSLSYGPRSPAFRRLCARDEDTCRLLADFHAQVPDAKRERRRARNRSARFRISDDNVAQAQRFNFQVLANSLRVEDLTRLSSLAERSLKEVDCPRNLSAALAIKSEEHFPDPKARSLAKELFDHARQCLQPDEEIYERLFLRYALYAYYDGDKVRARELLLQAKRGTNSTERYRVLYWLGRIAYETEGKTKDNSDWNELASDFPLSYYAIDAAVTLGRDPLEMITQRKVGELKREANDDPELNRMIRWLEALYLHKHSSSVARWASWIVRSNEDELDVDVLLYLSSLKIAAGMYRSNIQMLFGYFRKNPAALNEEGLKLLYPRPYYSLIQDASQGKIDTYLVLGLVRQESAFDARALSRVKAGGLMQIIPQTARRLASQGHKKLMNEKENTKMGVKYLLQLSGDFGGSVELVLAAYNAGPNKVTEWLRRNPDRNKNLLLWNDLIPYMETRDYVVSILRNNYLYARLYGEKEPVNPNLFSSDLVKRLLASKPATPTKK